MLFFDTKLGCRAIDDFLVGYQSDELGEIMADAGYEERLVDVRNGSSYLKVFGKAGVRDIEDHEYSHVVFLALGNEIETFVVMDLFSLVELLNKFAIFFPTPIKFQ